MYCSHQLGIFCIDCRPEFWHPSQEEINATNRRIYQEIVEKLIRWNKAYREGDAEVTDAQYDIYENSLKRAYPKHPIFAMVGHDESKVEEILDYIKSGNNPRMIRITK